MLTAEDCVEGYHVRICKKEYHGLYAVEKTRRGLPVAEINRKL